MGSYQRHASAYISPAGDVGDGTKIWHHANVAPGAYVGKNCTIGQNCYVAPGAVVGNRVKLQNNVSVYQGVILEDDVFCGPGVVFTNVLFPRSEFPKGPERYEKTLVRKGASIGGGAVVVAGNVIGRYALVGAGAVVANDVPDHAVVMGNPARQTGWVCRCGTPLSSDLVCGACRQRYRESETGLVPAEQP